MSRGLERALRRSLIVATVIAMLAVACLIAQLVFLPQQPIAVSTVLEPPSSANSESLPVDPKLDRLTTAKMSRTVKEQANVVVKPPTPDLSTLIQLRGIFAFGDPKDSEALVESLRTNQTTGYKVGQSVKGVEATVIKIAKNVTFKYDGKEVTLDIKSNDRASNAPVATPGSDSPMVASDRR
jgi:hypothetical protein